jgi:hypothetical protein
MNASMTLHEPPELPPGFGLRQPSGVFEGVPQCESGGEPPQSKTRRVDASSLWFMAARMHRLRPETTMTLKWIVDQLKMGHAHMWPAGFTI